MTTEARKRAKTKATKRAKTASAPRKATATKPRRARTTGGSHAEVAKKFPLDSMVKYTGKLEKSFGKKAVAVVGYVNGNTGVVVEFGGKRYSVTATALARV